MTVGLGMHANTACQVVSDKDFRLLGDRASYVSWEGMFFESRETVSVGDDVIVSLQAPGTGEWLDAEARVARIVPLGDGHVHGVGLRFARMDDASRETLFSALGPRATPMEEAFAQVRK
jgi:Tfp pilus assembly protein PilZ